MNDCHRIDNNLNKIEVIIFINSHPKYLNHFKYQLNK